jgi:hypothetical protein
MIIKPNNTQMINVTEGKKMKLEMPMMNPILNMIPFAFGWL